MKKDIFKIDNWLIRFGWFLIAISVLSILFAESTYSDYSIKSGNTRSYHSYKKGENENLVRMRLASTQKFDKVGFPFVRTFLLLNGFLMLFSGILIRKKEKKLIAIWDMVEKGKEVSVHDLVVSIGVSREFIHKNLKVLNSIEGISFIYRSESDKIICGSLAAEFIVESDCESCGYHANLAINLDFYKVPSCPSCGMAVSADQINKIKADILSKPQKTPEKEQQFNGWLFLGLLFCTGPLAILYPVLYFSGVLPKVKVKEVDPEEHHQMVMTFFDKVHPLRVMFSEKK